MEGVPRNEGEKHGGVRNELTVFFIVTVEKVVRLFFLSDFNDLKNDHRKMRDGGKNEEFGSIIESNVEVREEDHKEQKDRGKFFGVTHDTAQPCHTEFARRLILLIARRLFPDNEEEDPRGERAGHQRVGVDRHGKRSDVFDRELLNALCKTASQSTVEEGGKEKGVENREERPCEKRLPEGSALFFKFRIGDADFRSEVIRDHFENGVEHKRKEEENAANRSGVFKDTKGEKVNALYQNREMKTETAEIAETEEAGDRRNESDRKHRKEFVRADSAEIKGHTQNLRKKIIIYKVIITFAKRKVKCRGEKNLKKAKMRNYSSQKAERKRQK